jgi:hypothetical protein
MTLHDSFHPAYIENRVNKTIGAPTQTPWSRIFLRRY